MKYLKKFNESLDIDYYEDCLFSFFDKDPNFMDKGDNWIYVEYNQFLNPSDGLVQIDIAYENLTRYLNGPRFVDKVIKSEVDYGDFYILIIDKNFYNKSIKVEELNWEPHRLVKDIDNLKNLEPTLANYQKNYLNDARMVKGLPNNCSLIRGLNFSGGIEFWPQNSEPDPIYVKNNIELQYLLYKHTT